MRQQEKKKVLFLIDLPMNIQRSEVEHPVYDMDVKEMGLEEFRADEAEAERKQLKLSQKLCVRRNVL